jgi:hypothetical protein
MDATTDPMCPSFPDSHVIMDSGEQRSISESPSTQPQSAYKTRQFDRMSKNIGAKVRRVFFINGTSGPLDFFEGTVRSITSANKYDIVYDDNDSEEMSEREFSHFSLPPKAQARAHVARLGGDQWLKELSSCNCAEGHCYHPWAKHTPHFNPSVSPSDGKMVVAKSGIRKSDTSEGKMKYPTREPPLIPDYYAACHFPETMPEW